MKSLVLILFSCLVASTLASAKVDPEAQAKFIEFFSSPEMQPFVDYLRHLATKNYKVTLPKDDRAVFDTCQSCIDNFGGLIDLYNTLGLSQDAFYNILKVS